jgi:hypothetical protein
MLLKELLALNEGTPEYDEFYEDLDELVKLKYAVKAWDIATPFDGSDGATELHGWWLYEGYESAEDVNEAKRPKIVATVVEGSGEHQNAGAVIYEDRKVTAAQALRWYVKEMDSDDDEGGW